MSSKSASPDLPPRVCLPAATGRNAVKGGDRPLRSEPGRGQISAAIGKNMIGYRARVLAGMAALMMALAGCQASGGKADGCKDCKGDKKAACMMKCEKCGTTAGCEMVSCPKCKGQCKSSEAKMTCPGCGKEICSACKMMEAGANGSMKCPGCGHDVKCADMVLKCKCGAELKGADMMKCSKCGGMMACSCAKK